MIVASTYHLLKKPKWLSHVRPAGFLLALLLSCYALSALAVDSAPPVRTLRQPHKVNENSVAHTKKIAAMVTMSPPPGVCQYVPSNITVSGFNGLYAPYNNTILTPSLDQYNNTFQWVFNNLVVRWTGSAWEMVDPLAFSTVLATNSTGSINYLPTTGWVSTNGSPTLSGGTGLLFGNLTTVIVSPTSSTIASGGSLTLTASGATSYTWSNGVQSSSVVLTNVTSATTLSVTAIQGSCMGTASATVSVTALTFCNTTVYVTPTGNGTKNGSSWANALPGNQLPSALATACTGTTFLVGAGLYMPGISPSASFTVPSGVQVYGGYTVTGNTATRGAVDPTIGTPSSTTFSGDLDNNSVLDDNNSSVLVMFTNASAATRLDGLVLTGAYNPLGRGACIVNTGENGGVSNPTLINCLITDNSAQNQGGGMRNNGSGGEASPTLTNCVFRRNETRGGSGGALYLDGTMSGKSNPILTNCIVSNNSASNSGGAIYADGDGSGMVMVSITGSVFSGNSAQSSGGALYGNSAVFALQSSTLTTNSSQSEGGAIYTKGGSFTLTNSLVSQNTVSIGSGGGIYAINGEKLVFIQTDVLQNQATQSTGGGIYTGNDLIITGGSFSQNWSHFQGGGINFSGEQAVLTGVTISQNTAASTYSGGGGFAGGEIDNVQIQSCTIAQNTADGAGAGINIAAANSVTVNNTMFDRNIGTNTVDYVGGGGFAASHLQLGQFSSCTFTGNAHAVGGGLSVPQSSSVTVTGSIFTGNVATGTQTFMGGGAIYATTTSLTITDSQFSQNTANSQSSLSYESGGGGAIMLNLSTGGETACIQSSTFTQNAAPEGHGGAIVTQGSSGINLKINRVSFIGNQAANMGGALFDNSTSLTITSTQFTSNSASGGGAAYVGAPYAFSNVQWTNNFIAENGVGGALFADSYNNGTIVNSLFQQNGSSSNGVGGAMYANGGNHVLINTNLNRNAAQTGGAVSGGASFSLINCTLNHNQASQSGTLFSGGEGANFVVQNSILWNNAPATSNFQYLNASDITLQNSLIDPTSSAYTDGGGNRTADPMFMNEANNDLTLLACSPAINSGDNALYTAANGAATDLAGLTRPFNTTVDMGAYEFQGTPNALTATITGNQTICSGSNTMLTAHGGSSFIWSTGETTSAITVSPVSTTAYSVTVGSDGCSASTTATITVNSSPTVTVSPSTTTITGGQLVTLTAQGGNSFTWSTGESTSAITVSPNESTNYTVSGSNGGSCRSTATATVSVTCNANVTAHAYSLTQTAVLSPNNCSVELIGTGYGTGYVITGPSGYVFSAVYRKVGAYTIRGLDLKQPGTYTLRVSYLDACGNSNSEAITYVVTGVACK